MSTRSQSGGAATVHLLTTLGVHLGHAGTYDYQRRGNRITGYTHLQQFRPISNINVGLLSQQAGLTLEETLSIAGKFASMFSSNADPRQPYGLDPLTLHYIKRGYEIGESGLYDRPPGQ
ncbi:MAG: hypothetical protein FJX11_03615 [Alphaproteobacteria bacterium]|nr:hypothetical protein [Alphaproteobacteria bacterium]